MQNYEINDFKRAAQNPSTRHAEENQRRSKQRLAELPFGATEANLFALWMAQKGRCALCGIEMDLIGKSHVKGWTNPLRLAVDRIVPELWYIKDNLRLLHHICNSFKNILNDQMVYAIARGIVKTFEENNPNLRIDISPELVTRDGKIYMHYPIFRVTGNPKNIVVPEASKEAFKSFAASLLAGAGSLPESVSPSPPKRLPKPAKGQDDAPADGG
jgi:hypothetical protein